MQIEPFPDLDSDEIAVLPAPAGAPARWASLLAHWRAWLPILMRVMATGLALLGLAGIGLAARGSSELPALAGAPLAFGFAQMLGSVPHAAGAGAARSAAAPGEVRLGEVAPPQCACDEPVPCATAPATAPPSAPPSDARAAQAVSDVGGAVLADGRVILNLAGALELQRLPGIGAKRAAAILELRGRLGRFRRTSDLLRVKGIGRRTLERMSPQLMLDAPAQGAASAAPGAR